MTSKQRRSVIQAIGAGSALATLGMAPRVHAQALDTVRIVCGFPPGGTSDVTSRRVGERMRANGYARNVIVENRTGAGGQIAVQAMKGAPTDGSMLLMTPASMLMMYPHIYRALPYDSFTDVVPASLAVSFEFGFAVGPTVPATVKTVPEFLAWAKANPAQANFGSPGAGSVPHFVGTLLGRSAGVELKHIPFRGSQPAVADMVGGNLQSVSAPLGEFLAMAAAGRIRLLGVSGPKRSRFAPNVPTYIEQGMAGMEYGEWFGFFLPAKTPNDVVDRTNAALRAALMSQDVIDGVAAMGLESTPSTPAELGQRLRRDHDRWGPIVKQIGFTADS